MWTFLTKLDHPSWTIGPIRDIVVNKFQRVPTWMRHGHLLYDVRIARVNFKTHQLRHGLRALWSSSDSTLMIMSSANRRWVILFAITVDGVSFPVQMLILKIHVTFFAAYFHNSEFLLKWYAKNTEMRLSIHLPTFKIKSKKNDQSKNSCIALW